MKWTFTIGLFIIITAFCNHCLQAQYRSRADTSHTSLSLYARTGINFYYPKFQPIGNSTTHLVNPIGEIGLNISVGKAQLGIGAGYYAVIANEKTGSINTTRTEHLLCFPISGGAQILNIRKNILHLRLSFIPYIRTFSVNAVDTMYTNRTVSSYTVQPQRGVGFSTSIGLQYSRRITDRLLFTFQTDINFTLVPAYSNTGSYYNSYYPNNTLQIGIEYFFGRKRAGYLEYRREKFRQVQSNGKF